MAGRLLSTSRQQRREARDPCLVSMRSFIPSLLALSAILNLSTIGSVSAAAGRHQKPLAPVKLTIAPLSTDADSRPLKPGGTIELLVSATADLEIDEMLIETSFLGGSEYVSGSRSWRGSARPGEGKSLLVTARIPQSGDGKVRASITLFKAGKKVLTKQAAYNLGSSSDSGPAKPSGPVRRDAKGREVVEQ